MKLLLVLSLALAAADALPGFLRGVASHDEVAPTKLDDADEDNKEDA